MSQTVASLPVAPDGRTAPGRDAGLRAGGLGVTATTVALSLATLWQVLTLQVDSDSAARTATALFVTGMTGLGLAGGAVVRQQPRATVGWLLCVTGLLGVASRFGVGLAIQAHLADAGWAEAVGWFSNWCWVPAQAMALVLVLRFPDGLLPGPRWRWVERAILAWLVVTVAVTAVVPGELGVEALSPRTNPLGIPLLEPLTQPLLSVTFIVAPMLALAAVTSPVSRWWTGDEAARRQLRTVAVALVLLATTAPLALVSGTGVFLEGVAYLALPGAIAWGVLRHRLWDFDLRRRLDRLQVVRQEERSRLQRELHDTLGPLLGSIGMRAEAARNMLRQGATDRLDDALGGIDRDTVAAVVEVRRMIDELGPSVLADTDLATALRALAAEYTTTGLAITVIVPELPGLDPQSEIVAYRVASEAVRNVVRHAQAERCRLEVRMQGASLVVTVADDGIGLGGHPPGVGRRGMAARVAEVGGTFTSGERPGGGAVVTAVLPGVAR